MTSIVTGSTANHIPFAQVGGQPTLVVLNGGQGFVRRSSPSRLERDARRVAKVLPAGQSFVLLGYEPEPALDLSIDDVTAATRLAIADLIPDRVVDLVGISYGGMVACRLVAATPERFRRLVLVASGYRFSATGTEHVRRQIALLDAGNVTRFAELFGGLFRRRFFNWLIGATTLLSRKHVLGGMSPSPAIVRYLEAMLRGGPVDLAAISIPTLVMGGSADQFFGDGIMEETAAAIPGAELRLFPRETHMAPVEIARTFRAEASRFIAEI